MVEEIRGSSLASQDMVGCHIPEKWERQDPAVVCYESCASLRTHRAAQTVLGVCGCVLASLQREDREEEGADQSR